MASNGEPRELRVSIAAASAPRLIDDPETPGGQC